MSSLHPRLLAHSNVTPPSKYSLGASVILVEPESVNMAGVVQRWTKSPYRIKAKEYNEELASWLYDIDIIDAGDDPDIIISGKKIQERAIAPMHKFNKVQYVTWQGRNWVIYKISLHKDMGSDGYKWGYFIMASKWVDNLRLEWTFKELWENAEGLKL